MSDSEKVRPVTRRELWWIFGSLSGVFLGIVFIVKEMTDPTVVGSKLPIPVEFVIAGTVTGYLALVAIAAWLESRSS